MVNIKDIREQVELMLNAGLSRALTYHDVHHTMDVTSQCMAIAGEEGIRDAQQLLELEIASLYHDTGFMFVYMGHEKKSCQIAREQLPGFGFKKPAIDNICKLIMATKVPQRPVGELQKIICDADLDYLGRKDFFETGDRLRLELISYKFISGEQDWEERQLNFLQNHHYFTETSRRKREPAKVKFIRQLLKDKKTTKT